MKRIILNLILLTLFTGISFSQVYSPVSWAHTVKKTGDNEYIITFHASIEQGWHMYGLKPVEDGPRATSINFNDSSTISKMEESESSRKPHVKYDPNFQAEIELFDGEINFTKKIEISKTTSLEGYVEYMVCNDMTCLPPATYDFEIELKGDTELSSVPATEKSEKKTVSDEKKITINQSAFVKTIDLGNEDNTEIIEEALVIKKEDPEPQDLTDKTLLALFFIALAAGFGALLTPCVYPMIPLTVSFFMKEGQPKSKSVFNGIAFGISIILIYTFVGFISGVFKIDLVRLVSSHWIPNLVFFSIFILLALSFFGLFEIVLPSSIANKIDRQADKGGIMGPFFMALATVIVSFSCTGPIVGVVLGSALKGDIITPVVGMLGFSTSFALPFALLAIFPGVMGNLPKSGGWLNSVKVFFAFILLAFSLVFLSNIGVSFIGRDLILSLSIVIFALLGFYLLGKISFSHDSPVEKVSIFRLILAIFVFAISIYLVPGLWGKSLGPVEPFLPAAKTESMITANTKEDKTLSLTAGQPLCDENPKYANELHLPHGIVGYFDYEQGLKCAAEQGKPVFLDFVGHTCKNCKKMYAEVWDDPRVLEILKNEYIVIGLYTDDRTKLPEEDWYTSTLDGKEKKTLGKKNLAIQVEKFGTNAIPFYAIVNENGDVITEQKSYAYDLDVEKFIEYLKEGL